METPIANRNVRIAPDFSAFLYAMVGTDPNGSVISVLSAMARLNLDPWKEAATLSAMSHKLAKRRLASLIAATPGTPTQEDPMEATLTRLIALLPKSARSDPLKSGSPALPLQITAMTKSAITSYALYALIALVIGLIWLTAR